jgi:hypothetical protein
MDPEPEEPAPHVSPAIGNEVWVAHPSEPKGRPHHAVVIAETGHHQPHPSAPPMRVIRVRFDDGQEQILPEVRVSTTPPDSD